MNVNNLLAAMITEGKSKEDLAKELGINIATLYKKLNGTSDFKQSEMESIIKFLHLNQYEFERIFFTDLLTETQETQAS